MDSSLTSMLQCLGIAEDDQAKLLNYHQITDYQSLKDKHNDLKNQSLVNFPREQQLNLAATLVYLDSLNSHDPLSLFNRWDCMLFFANYNRNDVILVDDDDDNNESDDDDTDDDDDLVAYELIDLVDPEVIDLVDEEEEEEEDEDKEKVVEEDTDVHDSNDSNNVLSEENDTFEMTYQGFDEDDDDEDSIVSLDDDDDDDDNDNDNDDDENNKGNTFEYSSLSSMEFDGRTYHRWKCYHLQNNIVVGIKTFVSASKVYCSRVIPTSKTVLGVGEEGEEFCARIPYVQLKKQVLICLSKLGEEENNEMLDLIPDWIYEPHRDYSRSSSQTSGSMPITFSYIRDRTNLNTSNNKYLSNNSNVIRVRRKGLRILENIPTISGGSCMHSAFQQFGFQIAMSVFEMNTNDYDSNDAIAVAEFKMSSSNTDLPIYYGNMDDFTRALEDSSSNNPVHIIGRVDVIVYTATLLSVKMRSGLYCRHRFSMESNRFLDWLRITQPLIGVFDSDDISKFWSKVKIQSYLQKICTDCIKLGYQIRVMILGPSRYNDLHSPYSRRLIILAAKLFVKMPNPPAYNHNVTTNVVSDGHNGDTFPLYSIEESIARNVRDSVQYLHEEEIVELTLG